MASYSYGSAPTYVKVASYTATGTLASYTFSNIPQGYTDLILVTSGIGSGTENLECYINGDTGNNYSFTYLYGDGSSAASGRNASANRIVVGRLGTGTSHGIAHFQNYSSSLINKTVLTRKGKGSEIGMIFANIWLNNSPITSLQIFGAGSPAKTMSTGYTISLYGVKAALVPKAEGGDIRTDGTYWIHTFKNSGSFIPRQNLTADYLVVAGGGGGGNAFGAGGGAGGLRSTVTATGGGGTLESALSLSSGTNYTVTIGAGGIGAQDSLVVATSGSNSVFGSITSTGGGRGGTNGGAGSNGGSGGAGGNQGGTSTAAGTGTSGQGYAGGTGSGSANYGSGGGGGAGAVGNNGTTSVIGSGGAGVATSISGISTTYAGGGGGGATSAFGITTAGAGGSGGGGSGANSANSWSGYSGTANTGGGGGGGGYNGTIWKPAGNGASGIVIVRYAV